MASRPQIPSIRSTIEVGVTRVRTSAGRGPNFGRQSALLIPSAATVVADNDLPSLIAGRIVFQPPDYDRAAKHLAFIASYFAARQMRREKCSANLKGSAPA